MISKVRNGSFTVCANASYTVTITNIGGLPTDGPTTVVDQLPVGLTFVSAAGSGWWCSAANGVVTCEFAGPLLPGARASFDLTVAVGDAAYPTVTNTAVATTPGDTHSANNTASAPTMVRLADPGVTCDPDATPTPAPTPFLDVALVVTNQANYHTCEVGYFDLSVRNMGTGSREATVGPLTVVDTLPSSLTFLSAQGSGWSCIAAGQQVTCTYPASLSPNETTVFRMAVWVSASAYPTFSHRATVWTPHDGNDNNNVGSDQATVYAGDCGIAPPISPTPTASPRPSATPLSAPSELTVSVPQKAVPGSRIQIGARVKKMLAPVTIHLELPPELTLLQALPVGTVVENGVISWTLGSSPGRLVSAVVRVKVLVASDTLPDTNLPIHVTALSASGTLDATKMLPVTAPRTSR